VGGANPIYMKWKSSSKRRSQRQIENTAVE
jgi:hypothetical protein